MEYSLLEEHLGHSVEIARYGDEEITLECIDCFSVILEFRNPEFSYVFSIDTDDEI